MARIAGLLLGLLLLFPAISLRADDPTGADASAVRMLIQGQIDAFQRDDGAAAYAFASPQIHSIFPTAEVFMEMVRNSYQPVYRPRSVTFGAMVNAPMGLLQQVFLVGPDGKNYVAVYTLERQPDGIWKIGGCVVAPDDGKSI